MSMMEMRRRTTKSSGKSLKFEEDGAGRRASKGALNIDDTEIVTLGKKGVDTAVDEKRTVEESTGGMAREARR